LDIRTRNAEKDKSTEVKNSSELPHMTTRGDQGPYLEVDAVVVALPDGEAADEAAAGEAVLVHVHAVQTAVGLVLQPRLAAARRIWEKNIEYEETG
jgi:hypothetical protein